MQRWHGLEAKYMSFFKRGTEVHTHESGVVVVEIFFFVNLTLA
jgi:hypothetical protein